MAAYDLWGLCCAVPCVSVWNVIPSQSWFAPFLRARSWISYFFNWPYIVSWPFFLAFIIGILTPSIHNRFETLNGGSEGCRGWRASWSVLVQTWRLLWGVERGAVVINVWSANYERPVELHSHPGFFPLSQFKLFNFLAYSRGRCKPFPWNVDLLKFRCSFISSHKCVCPGTRPWRHIRGVEFPVPFC